MEKNFNFLFYIIYFLLHKRDEQHIKRYELR